MPKVTWERKTGGKWIVLETGDDIEFKFQNRKRSVITTVRFNNPRPEFEGDYRCRGENELGQTDPTAGLIHVKCKILNLVFSLHRYLHTHIIKEV